jgi:transcription elongation factor GreA
MMEIVFERIRHQEKRSCRMYDELTKSDIQKMEEEIEYRKLVVRKEALEAVKEARAQGDLSENFEYYAAKREKNQNESRIRYLERMVKTAKVIDDSSKEDEVGLFNTVTLYFEDDDEEETYKLLTTIRSNSMQGKISIDSPIGKAIMGHKVGDRVYVAINEKSGYYVEIRRIEKTVDDGNDELRKY